jgi:hypothetical protein
MRRSVLLTPIGVFAVLLLTPPSPLAGQTAPTPSTPATKAAAKPAPPSGPKSSAWKAPRTSWGDPDLQGIWSYATITPLERPDRQSSREFLNPEEVEALNADAAARPDRRSSDPRADIEQANAFWWDRGGSTGRTSLIVDPPEGKLPPLTPEGQRRRAAAMAQRRGHEFDSSEDRPLRERCITYHGVPPLPSGYNNHYQIVQAPGVVAIFDENIHDVRIVPLDGRPHLPRGIGQWNGDSRGHWKGDTLVVEITNYSPKTTLGYPISGDTLKTLQRFTRVGPGRIDHRYTIDDPGTYTRPWTVELPLTRIDGPLFEFACHEGNHSLPNILSGARAQEKAAAAREK